MTALATLAATQQLACRASKQMLRQQHAKMLMAAPSAPYQFEQPAAKVGNAL